MVSIVLRSPQTSLSYRGLAVSHRTVKWPITLLVFSFFAAASGEEGRKALMREIELGKLFGESEATNIIKFIGCVTTEGKQILQFGIGNCFIE